MIIAAMGQRLRVRVPPGFEAGDIIFVPVPKKPEPNGLMAWARRKFSVADS